jgi:hypothetical protein
MRAETDAGGMSGVDGDMHRCVGFKRELSSAAEGCTIERHLTAEGRKGWDLRGLPALVLSALPRGWRGKGKAFAMFPSDPAASAVQAVTCVGISFFSRAASWTCLPIRVFRESSWWLGLAVIDCGNVQCGVL